MTDSPRGHGPLTPPTYSPPAKVREPLLRRLRLGTEIDNLFFALASLSVLLLAAVLFRQGLRLSWSMVYLIGFWLVLAYVALPRVHWMLTRIYVPDYFVGRTHTTDGLLGDPVNLAVRGTAGEIHAAMQRAGWTPADPVTLRSAGRIVTSSLLRRSYPEAPVSPLLLFGQRQAFAYQQEVEGNPARRHHVRFWPTPDGWLLPGGERVDFLAAGTYDRSVGLSLFTLQVTHKIDADIDAERDYILASVRYANPSVATTVLTGFSTGYHSRNGGGDQVRTDGDLPILELTDLPASPAPAIPVAHEHGLGARPPAVVAGVVLILLAAVLDPFTYLPAAAQAMSDAHVAADEVAVVLATLVVVFGVFYLVLFLLLALTFRGHGWARRLLLAALTFQLVVQLSGWVTLPAGSLSVLAIVGTSFYVLAVYALSSLAARDWTAHHLRSAADGSR
ncbi:LssY C-terminal domain-containing protein [Propionicicella superfundia]|uniref:LssY C-terminal domain-containing protein n=1 Tax=Propionicicella superfundia TaxID=348582 RepID=UPI00040C445A|nr:LssY C-terminal domain-containing protein [Propionicicella superfundia]